MVQFNKIYTRSGDRGRTRLADSSPLAKSSIRIEAIGAVDEANAGLGLLSAALGGHEAKRTIARIQNDLFDLATDLATPGKDFEPNDAVQRLIALQVAALEQEIDKLELELDPLTSFALPGGSEPAARAYMARGLVRRAERSIVALDLAEQVNPAALAYINRLSDYLFVLARSLNAADGGEVLWKPRV
jgi:cob(I)alamin adenosyltransferase